MYPPKVVITFNSNATHTSPLAIAARGLFRHEETYHMKIIDSPEAIAALRATGQHPPTLLDLIAERMAGVKAAYAEAGAAWDPAEQGAFAIMEEGDGADQFEEVGLNAEDGLAGACWEFCQHHPDARAHEVLHLFSNDGGWTLFVPDAPWVDPVLRTKLEAEATDPFDPETTGDDADRSPF